MSVCIVTRPAIFGFPNASGEPEGIAVARSAAVIAAIVFSLFAVLLLVVLIRELRQLLRGKDENA
jgi:uncharacterized membrane protein YtjA (UPF0391 family)